MYKSFRTVRDSCPEGVCFFELKWTRLDSLFHHRYDADVIHGRTLIIARDDDERRSSVYARGEDVVL